MGGAEVRRPSSQVSGRLRRVTHYSALESFDFDTALAVSNDQEVLSTAGDVDQVFEWKSVTKPLSALAILIAIDQGSLALDQVVPLDVSEDEITVKHLLAHVSGLSFDRGGRVNPVGERRIYSNWGFEELAEFVGTELNRPFDAWVRESVLEPLELDSVIFTNAAHGARGNVLDVLGLGLELAEPTLLSHALWESATTVQFPGLSGLLPGYGPQTQNDWGLGLEIKDSKTPHWTGSSNSSQTFGHFGASGSFLWVDPHHHLVAAFLGARPFGSTHLTWWPSLNDQIIAEHGNPK